MVQDSIVREPPELAFLHLRPGKRHSILVALNGSPRRIMAHDRWVIGFFALVLCFALVGCEDSCPTCTGSTTMVRGFVLDGNGIGIKGVTVHVVGKPPVQTASNGSFTFGDVATPYDLVYEAGPNDVITAWRDVTRLDPVIRGYTRAFAGVDTARVSGSAPAVQGRITIVFYLAQDAFVTGTRVDVARQQYSLRLGWSADSRSRSGRLFLLRYLQDPFSPRVLDYDGFASQSLEASPGGVYRVDFSHIDDPIDRTIAGTVSVPADYQAISAQLFMEAEQQTVPLENSRLDGGEFAVVAPQLRGVTYRVAVDAVSAQLRRRVFTARGGLHAGDRADITIRPAPEPLVPLQDQVVDRATSFSWRDEGPPVLHIVRVYSSRTYVIHVVGTETRIDDLPGPGLAAGRRLLWDVYRIDGQSVVDPFYQDLPRESFAVSEPVVFDVASGFAGQP